MNEAALLLECEEGVGVLASMLLVRRGWSLLPLQRVLGLEAVRYRGLSVGFRTGRQSLFPYGTERIRALTLCAR